MQGLVSIITPCYNGEKYISRFLDSVLNQDYSNIELILIDDGSTDKTAEIIQSYSSHFSSKGYSLTYIFQENQGQACALNKGLKIFKGDYLTWPDSDDFLSTDAISLRVDFLKNNMKYGFVRSDAAFYNEKNLNECVRLATSNIHDKYREKLFDDLIFEKDAYVCNGCYMVRRSSFLVSNPERLIYESRAGQNWQILIPLAFNYLCGFIDKPLYNIVIRKNSHSRSGKSIDERFQRLDGLEDILVNLITSINIDKRKYLELIREKYIRRKLMISHKEKDRVLVKYFYLKLNNKDISDKILYFISKFNLYLLITAIKKTRSFLKKVKELLQ